MFFKQKIVWIFTFLSVVLLNVDVGLIIGLSVSIFSIVINDQFFNLKSLSGNNSSTELIRSHNLPVNVKIYKIETSIYFANCENVKKKLLKACGFNSMEKLFEAQKKTSLEINVSHENGYAKDENQIDLKKIEKNTNNQKLIIDFSAVNYIDTNGVKMLLDIVESMKKANIFVYICSPQGIEFIFLLF